MLITGGFISPFFYYQLVAHNRPWVGKNLEKRLRKLVHLSIDKFGFVLINLLNKLIAVKEIELWIGV